MTINSLKTRLAKLEPPAETDSEIHQRGLRAMNKVFRSHYQELLCANKPRLKALMLAAYHQAVNEPPAQH